MTALAPLVWIDPIIEKPVTESGIILHTFTPKPNKGLVIAIGAKCDPDNIGSMKVHDTVLFNPHHATKREYNGHTYLTVPDTHIMAILPDDQSIKVEVEDHELK